MPIIQHRKPSLELLRLRELSIRKELSNEEKWELYQKESVYAGELKLDTYYEKCPEDWLILNDLWFNYENNIFQNDSLLITPKNLYNLDAKNNQDEYELIKEKLYKNGKETKNNPLLQIKRSDSLLRHLLTHKLQCPYPTASKLMFVNPNFTLFGVNPNDLIICLPTQINRFFEKLRERESSIGTEPSKPTPQQINLANQLLAIQLHESPYIDKTDCDFNTLKKGIPCAKCNIFLLPPIGKQESIACQRCGHKEKVKKAILRNIDKFRLLFPNKLITLKSIIEWCDIIYCEKRVFRVLNENFQRVGSSIATHYVERINWKTSDLTGSKK